MTRPIELQNVSVLRDDAWARSARRVVEGLSANIAAGERVALVGANGAGKTSLLLGLVGALELEGRVAYGELVLAKKTLQRVRREVGFVFAEPADQLFLPTVLAEARYAPEQRGHQDADGRARRALRQVGLEGFEDRPPGTLSLGEQRRLALATVLSAEASVLLLDEPTAALDGRARRAVLAALARAPATLMFATHDLRAALELEARVLLLSRGKLVAQGPARELLSDAAVLDRAGLDPID
jgi:cobalt/nickel transport system ATP-binding protein